MSSRDERVPSIIAESAAAFLLANANSSPLITVTRANVSPDRKRATVFVSVLPDDRADDALAYLARSAGDFRAHLKKHAALTRIPHIDFALDPDEHARKQLDEAAG